MTGFARLWNEAIWKDLASIKIKSHAVKRYNWAVNGVMIEAAVTQLTVTKGAVNKNNSDVTPAPANASVQNIDRPSMTPSLIYDCMILRALVLFKPGTPKHLMIFLQMSSFAP